MAVDNRSALRGIARQLMSDMEDDSLGTFAEGPLRDTFRLNPDLPAIHMLTTRQTQRNFIRSEDNSLLFRNAAPALVAAAGQSVMRLRKAESKKGLEFLWSQLDSTTLRHLFVVVIALARQPNELEFLEVPSRISPGDVLHTGQRTSFPSITRTAHETALDFEFIPGDVIQAGRLIYAWEIKDPSGRLRYRYIGKSEPGAERPLRRYARNVANLLAGRPYRLDRPTGFRVVHKRLADAVEWLWPITLRLIANVSSSENIFIVESCHNRKLAYDDWPSHGRR